MITNSKDNVIVSGSNSDDFIVNHGNYVTVKANAGNDWVGDYGKNSTVITGTGDDTIYDFGEKNSINSGNGSDLIYLSTTEGNTTVTSGTGRDTIGIQLIGNGKTAYTQVTVTDLDADDTIYFDKSIGYLYAYVTGNDLLFTNSMYLTVKNITDKKLNEIKKVKVIHGGYVTTIGNLMTRKISIDDNVAVYGTQDRDSITVYGKNNTVYGYDGNDDIYIADSAKNITVYGDAGDDYILCNGDNVAIYGNKGNDYFFVYNSDSTSIVGGEGNDTVCFGNENSDFHMNGGTGDDYFILPVLYSNNEIPTITGGTGKDIIKVESWTYRNSSDLHCQAVITDLQTNEDVLSFYQKINSLTASKENNNLVLKDDSGVFSVTLTGITSTDEIKDVVVMNNETYANSGSETTIGKLLTNRIGSENQKKTQLDVIREFMSSLDKTELKGVEAVDEAVKFASNGQFENYGKLIENFVSDCKKAKDSETFLKNYCSIDLDNNDTGAITGWDAGGIDVKTAESIVSEKGNLKKYSKSVRHEDKNSGLTLIWNEPKAKKSSVTSTQKKIVQGLDSWWFEGALSLITETYGMDLKKENGATVNEITLDFDDINSEYMKNYISEHPEWSPPLAYVRGIPSSDNKTAEKLILWVNTDYFQKINLNKDKNGIVTIKGETIPNYYLDRFIAHELTHALIFANVNYWGELPSPIFEGIPELTQGADYRSDDKPSKAKGKPIGISPLIESFQSNDRSLEDCVSDVINDKEHEYVMGYTLLRYFSKQVSRKSGVQDGVKCNGDKTSVKLTSEFKGTFKADEYFSTIKNIDASRDKNSVIIYGNAKDNNILGGSGKDKLYGYAGKDVINGGAGDDMLTGGKGNDNLTGGKGKDTFVYANGDGKDTITDYTAGQDKIKITEGSIGSFKITGTDVVFTIGKGSISIKNGVGKKITVIDSKGNEKTKVYGLSRKVASLWFTDEDTNFSTPPAQIDSITKSRLSDDSLGNVNTSTDWTTLTSKDSLSSGLAFSEN